MNDIEQNQKHWQNYHKSSIEMRGVWHMPHTLTSDGYDETTYEGVIKLLDTIKQIGFNTIFVETTISAYTVYPSRCATTHPDFIFSDHRFGIYGNDYLACFIGEAHHRGMRVHAWTTTMRAGKFQNTLEHSLPASIKASWLCRGYHQEVGLDGKYGCLMWMDPTQLEVEQYLIDQYRELLLHYDFDGIEFDAIRYPVSNLLHFQSVDDLHDFGYTNEAMQQFKKQIHFDGDIKPELLKNYSFRMEWIRFRAQHITRLVKKIRDLIIDIKPDCMISAAVFPNSEHAYTTVCQDWAMWIKNNWLDFISPMAYSLTMPTVIQSYEETTRLVKDKLFNFQGIASIIHGGDGHTHFEQMDWINAQGGMGAILFSIRQLLRNSHALEMTSWVYHHYPAISPLEPLEDIFQWIIKEVNFIDPKIQNKLEVYKRRQWNTVEEMQDAIEQLETLLLLPSVAHPSLLLFLEVLKIRYERGCTRSK